MDIKDRLKEIRDYAKMGQTNFEKHTGISSGYFNKVKSSIGSDTILKIINKFPEINVDWLITGKGEMLKKTEAEKPSINYVHKGSPYYNVDFIGGFDLVLNDQTLNPDYYIDFAPFNKDGVVWCNLTGHSMEPELSNGDYIAMKEMTDPIEYLPYGEVYGFITNSYRTVKRMGKSDKDGFIRLIPTNKSPEYSDQDIPISMIRKVYAVLGSMHRLF